MKPAETNRWRGYRENATRLYLAMAPHGQDTAGTNKRNFLPFFKAALSFHISQSLSRPSCTGKYLLVELGDFGVVGVT